MLNSFNIYGSIHIYNVFYLSSCFNSDVGVGSSGNFTIILGFALILSLTHLFLLLYLLSLCLSIFLSIFALWLFGYIIIISYIMRFAKF